MTNFNKKFHAPQGYLRLWSGAPAGVRVLLVECEEDLRQLRLWSVAPAGVCVLADFSEMAGLLGGEHSCS